MPVNCKPFFGLELDGNRKAHKPMGAGASMKAWGSCLKTINADVLDFFSINGMNSIKPQRCRDSRWKP